MELPAQRGDQSYNVRSSDQAARQLHRDAVDLDVDLPGRSVAGPLQKHAGRFVEIEMPTIDEPHKADTQ